jgi:hypothetical protein
MHTRCPYPTIHRFVCRFRSEFLNDLRGVGRGRQTALIAAAREKPAEFVRIVTNLLPARAEFDVNVFTLPSETIFVS